MPRGSRRRSGSRSPKRRRGSRAARKSPRRSRSPKRSPRRFKGVQDDEVYRGRQREDHITDFKNIVAKRQITLEATAAKDLLMWHLIFNADEIKDKQSHIAKSLEELCAHHGVPYYAEYMIRIGPRARITDGTSLATVVYKSLYALLAAEFGDMLERLMLDLIEAWKQRLFGTTHKDSKKRVNDKFQRLHSKLLSIVDGLKKGIDIEKALKDLIKMSQKEEAYHGALVHQFPDTIKTFLRKDDPDTSEPKIPRLGLTSEIIEVLKESPEGRDILKPPVGDEPDDVEQGESAAPMIGTSAAIVSVPAIALPDTDAEAVSVA